VLVFGAAGFLVWFSLKNIEPPAGKSKLDFILETWEKADKFLFILSGVLAVLSHVVRAERWRLLLSPIGYKVGLVPAFFSVMGGYFINLAIPRGGELFRCINLFRLSKVPVETSAGTVVVERIIDVVFLLGFVGASFLIEYDKLLEIIVAFLDERKKAQAMTQEGPSYLWVFVLVSAVAALFVLFWAIKKGKLDVLLSKLNGIWLNMKMGLLSIFKLEAKFLFLFYSLLIWVLYFLMAWLCMMAFGETKVLGLEAAVTIFTLGSIAMAMPFPGGAGSYHFLVPLGLSTLYGLAKDKALAFTFVFHAWQTLVIIVFGLISLIGSQVSKSNESRG
jgi:uncharacterized protein (TIRG00374 family)